MPRPSTIVWDGLLTPAAAELSQRHVGALSTWGIESIEIEADEAPEPEVDISPEIEAAARAELLVVRFEEGAPRFVVGDAGRIRQVIMNLAGNAVRFTDEGHVKVLVGRAGDGRVSFAVEDTGVGIQPDCLELMFEKFTQVGKRPREAIRRHRIRPVDFEKPRPADVGRRHRHECARAGLDLHAVDPARGSAGAARAARVGGVPIMALTADHRKSERDRAHEAGMNDYLTKPLLLPALRTDLDRWLPVPDKAAAPTERVASV